MDTHTYVYFRYQTPQVFSEELIALAQAQNAVLAAPTTVPTHVIEEQYKSVFTDQQASPLEILAERKAKFSIYEDVSALTAYELTQRLHNNLRDTGITSTITLHLQGENQVFVEVPDPTFMSLFQISAVSEADVQQYVEQYNSTDRTREEELLYSIFGDGLPGLAIHLGMDALTWKQWNERLELKV